MTLSIKVGDLRLGDVICLKTDRRRVEELSPMFPTGTIVRARSAAEDGNPILTKRYPAHTVFTVERA